MFPIPVKKALTSQFIQFSRLQIQGWPLLGRKGLRNGMHCSAVESKVQCNKANIVECCDGTFLLVLLCLRKPAVEVTTLLLQQPAHNTTAGITLHCKF